MAVFGLKKIYLNQVANNYENYDQVTVSSYGYYGGGQISYPGSYKSDFDRLDYSNETTTLLSSTISLGTAHHSVVQKDAEYGYLAGGFGGPTDASVSNVDKIDLTTEVVSRLPVNYPRAIYGAYGVYNPQYGYYAGYDDGDGSSSYIDRLNFSDETFSTITAVLPDSKRLTSGLHSSVYGYWTGGTPGGGTGRINFSDETVASIPGLPSLTARTSALTSDAAILYSGNGSTCSIDRFTFSGETTVTTNALRSSSSASEYVGSSESPQYGYFVAGGAPATSTIDRYDFSHDTNVRSTSSLTTVRGRMSGGGGINGGSKITRGKPQFNSIQREINQKSCGYIAGGILQASPSYITKSSVLKLDFSTDLSTELTANLSIAEPTGTNAVKSRDYGYFGGGYSIPGPFNTYCTIDRFDYASETMMTPGTGLTQNIGYCATTQTTSFGYFIGGQRGPDTCLITRLDFSSESTSQQSLYKSRKRASAIENQLYAYITGTDITSRTSEISRYDFVNETNAAIPAGTTAALEQSTATGNNQFGFIHLGYTPTGDSSTINRIDYSNETINAPGNNLTNQVRNAGGLSSNTFGYFGGGYRSPNTFVSTLDKIDFDTETKITTNSLIGYRGRITKGVEGKSTLTQTTYNTVPESASYGYFGGGYQGGAPSAGTSNIDRVDYETDTTSLPSAKIAFTGALGGSIRGKFAGIESTQFGYILGGQAPTPTLSTIQKLDFTSETLGVSDKNLSQVSRGGSAFKSRNYAYYGGSYINGPFTAPKTLERIDFDTETINVFGNLSKGRTFTASTQSRDYGYVTGGNNYPPGLSENNIDKVDLSNENISQPIYQFSTPIVGHKIAQNESNAYIFGGGGSFANATSYIRRLDFTDDSIALTPARVQRGNISGGEYTENSNYGYGSIGYSGPTALWYSQVERFDFQTETASSPGSTLSISRYLGASFSGGSALRQVGKNNRNDSRAGLDNQGRQTSASYGYSIGGSPNRYEVDRFDFLNETYFALNNSGSPAPFGASSQGGAVSNKSFGYYTGHQVPSGPLDRSIVARLDFTNDSWIDTPTIMTYLTHRIGTVYNHNYGYIAGGEHPTDTDYSFVNRLDFETESMNLLTATLSRGTERLNTGIMRDNTTSYGYFMGGYSTDSRVDRLDFNTESMALSTNLPQGQHFISAYSYGKSNLGYYVGGVNPSVIQSDIIRFDFTTETYTDTGNDSSLNLYGMNTTQNDNYGYGSMGGPGQDSTERIEFVTETASSPGATTNTSGSSGTGMSN